MDLEYRNLLAPNGPPLIPPSDFRSPQLPRPLPGVDFMQRSPDSVEMEKTPPVTGKRRGGSRKACNECKQQKVRHLHIPVTPTIIPHPRRGAVVAGYPCDFPAWCLLFRDEQLRCDIVQTPAAACSRCRRLGINCKVEPSFKRISKRRSFAALPCYA